MSKKPINLTCTNCGNHEVQEVLPAEGVGPLAKEAYFKCPGCGWFGNETALCAASDQAERRELLECLAEDRRRGEQGGGGGDAAGKSKDKKPGAEVRPEQGHQGWADAEGRATQEFLRDQIFGAKFTAQEALGLCRAIDNSRLTKSKWIQRALVERARQEMLAYDTAASVTTAS